MSSIIYELNLEGNLWSRLKKISIQNDEQIEKWAKVQTVVNDANKTMLNMGRSIGSINQRISALKAQKEWIPTSNREAIRAVNREVEKLEKELTKLHSLDGGAIKRWKNELKSAVPALNMLTNPVALAAAGAYKLTQKILASRHAYMEESIEVAKLTQVMRNMMSARQDEIDGIMALTSAQQKLGVIGDEVQLAGAQELSTYLTKADSLHKLIPAMNDMLAQQYGINASQEQAQNIAMMLGKVMQGQTGALSRYGYSFTEAQEKILKYGTEAQKAATLSEVVAEAVGGVNEALASTPEGKLKQQANNMGDLQERVGRLVVVAQSALAPITEKLMSIIDKIVSFFGAHEQTITRVVKVVSSVATGIIGVIWNMVQGVGGAIKWIINGVRNANAIIIVLAGAITGIIGAMILWKAWAIIATAATMLWNGAMLLFNTIASLNPIGIIIAAIVALIAIIAYVAMSTTGWGKTWQNTMDYMKLAIGLFVSWVDLKWLTIKNAFHNGFDSIAEGWYKLKSLWDKDGAREGLNKLREERDRRANEILEAQKKVNATREQMANMTIWEVKGNGKSIKDFTTSLKDKLGMGTNTQLQAVVSGGMSKPSGIAGGEQTNSSIVTGGQRNTTVNIRFNDMVGSINLNGSFADNKANIEQQITEIMARVLGMAEVAV